MKLFGIFLISLLLHGLLLFYPLSNSPKKLSAKFKKGTVVTSVILKSKIKKIKKKVKKKVVKKNSSKKSLPAKIKEEVVEETTTNEVVGVNVGSVIEFRPVPKYPKISRIRGEVGKVGVSVSIDQKGIVETAKVVVSSGYERLDKAAKEASLKASFSPAIKNGVQVASDQVIYYQFELK